LDPPRIPDHTLLWPIGRGAYGEVWLARNVMGTLRAVKVIHRRQEEDRAYEREFAGIERYEPVSRSSGGLVHVLQVGRNDVAGYFYYVMELADPAAAGAEPEAGWHPRPSTQFSTPAADPSSNDPDARYSPRTLRSDLKRLGRLPTADCLRLALDVVTGLAQLHRHGLVHRDVNPGNIIYANGRAKLADIGLVSAGDEPGTFVGTEGYIPPEGPGTPTADLFGLGVVLYEASTGCPPERFPDVPSAWFKDSAGNEALEFHVVVLKACEGQRERRYQTADEMQADLALLQSGQSVRQIRALRRHYARLKVSAVVGTTLLVCAVGIASFAVGIASFASYRARLEAENRGREMRLRDQAEQNLIRAENAERTARQQLNAALLLSLRYVAAKRFPSGE
jgi:serine/threonine protein kinase